uniref:Uncharacterized protein n=1 Tax=Cacopsylla melanoneura TaxID=428564 RepID=A0A8D8UTX1_9HEMI
MNAGRLPLRPHSYNWRMTLSFLTLWYAWLISHATQNRYSFLAKVVKISFCRSTSWSRVDLFFLPPDCSLDINCFVSRYHSNLLDTIFSRSLHKHDVSDIGLRFSGAVLGLPRFGIGITSDVRHSFGNSCLVQILL